MGKGRRRVCHSQCATGRTGHAPQCPELPPQPPPPTHLTIATLLSSQAHKGCARRRTRLGHCLRPSPPPSPASPPPTGWPPCHRTRPCAPSSAHP
eukprot:scaffold9105_cov58-Phaeocystis_antarctica.AAC.4